VGACALIRSVGSWQPWFSAATRLTAALASIAVSVMSVAAQGPVPDLSYKERTGYSEGRRAQPSTVTTLDLVAAMVAGPEPYTSLPSAFHLAFFLPQGSNAIVTVREADNLYDYWLQTSDKRPWRDSRMNVVDWPTSTIIQWLTWRDRPLRLADLAAVARIGPFAPSAVEHVSPVALYHTQVPRRIESYAFAIRPDRLVRMRFVMTAVDLRRQMDPVQTFTADGRKPQWAEWKASEWPAGPYRLDVSAFDSSNAETKLAVHFLHRPTLSD
jgi:hypothetical protein